SPRDLRRGVGLRRAAEPSLVVQAPVLAQRLIRPVSTAFRHQLVLQEPSGQAQPLDARAWHRSRLHPPLLLELTVRLAPPRPAPAAALPRPHRSRSLRPCPPGRSGHGQRWSPCSRSRSASSRQPTPRPTSPGPPSRTTATPK